MLLISNVATAQTNTKSPWAEWNPTTTTLTFYYGDKPSSKEGVTIYDVTGYLYPTWGNPNGLDEEHRDIVAKITKVVFDESFKDARPTACSWWFHSPELKEVIGIENLNTSEVKDFNRMFVGCKNLKAIDVSHFNTAKATRFESMFYGCSSLTELDLTSFDTQNVEGDDDYHYGLYYMFQGCTSLRTIYASDNFITSDGILYSGDMFKDCTSLRGAIAYDASKTDGNYANYSKGYFSKGYALVGDTKVPLAGEETFAWELNLEDGSDFTANEAFTAKTATYKRTMTNSWGTLCLPYAFTASTADDYFYEIKSQTTDQLVVRRIDGTIAAGTPVLVYKKGTPASIEINATDAAVVTAPTAQTDGLVGTFKETDVPGDDYIIANNKFWKASDLSGSVGVKAYRAYIEGSAVPSAQSKLNICIDGTTTAIDALNAATDGAAECYDIQGRRQNGLHKGINIVKMNGTTKKIIIE